MKLTRCSPVAGRSVRRPCATTLASQVKANVTCPRLHRSVRMGGLARDILSAQADQIEGDPLNFLEVSEQYWRVLRNMKHEPEKKGPKVVTYSDEPLGETDYDVVICGGTLGLFLATALQQRGHRVCIVEKRLVQGRNQEWNISRGEVNSLVELGLLEPEELERAILSDFNPIRVGFEGGKDIWVRDCLNLGVHPKCLLEILRAKFEGLGGVILENCAFKAASVAPDGVQLTLAPGGREAVVSVGDTNRPNGMGDGWRLGDPLKPVKAPLPRSLRSRLLLDCMGHFSDIVKQIRGRVKPDGMVMVVGSCAEGIPGPNSTADLLVSTNNALDDMQLFWEAFPAEGGTARTTYMFAYSDATPERPSFESLLDTYFELLPAYQKMEKTTLASDLHYKRVLFGGFPCYNSGPLVPAFDRVMQIGDASCIQSPLSFGGFGSMVRHLGRLTRALDQALAENRLSQYDLGLVQPYQPSLSASWLFQRAMSFNVGQARYPDTSPEQAFQSAVTSGFSPQFSQQQASPFQQMAVSASADGASSRQSTATLESPEAPAGSSPSTATKAYSYAISSANNLRRQSKNQPSMTLQPRSTAGRNGGGSVAVPEWAMLPHTHVNELLAANFGAMGVLGDRVLRPFLQDTIQLVPLSMSMVGMLLLNPLAVVRTLIQVGPVVLGTWLVHYTALIAYTLAYTLLKPVRHLVPSFGFQRMMDALEYGSGLDYTYHESSVPAPGEQPMLPESAAEEEKL
ncbi:MAG: hypothetical protein WDW36_010116 [Sanguina aurantia]